MSLQFDQIFYMPENRIDQQLLASLLGCLESLPCGFPTETQGATVCTFLVHYEVENDQQCLGLTGSIPELGRWEAANAVKAQRVPAAGPNWWFAQAKVQCSTSFTWRWVVLGAGNEVVRMEGRAERSIGVFFKPAIYFCAWDSEDKSKLNEELISLKR